MSTLLQCLAHLDRVMNQYQVSNNISNTLYLYVMDIAIVIELCKNRISVYHQKRKGWDDMIIVRYNESSDTLQREFQDIIKENKLNPIIC